jgi:hypothetical protein
VLQVFDQREAALPTAAALSYALGQAVELAEGGHEKLMLQRVGTECDWHWKSPWFQLGNLEANNPGCLDGPQTLIQGTRSLAVPNWTAATNTQAKLLVLMI